METLAILCVVAVGIFAGLFLALPVIMLISLISITFFIYLHLNNKFEGLGGLVAIVIVALMVIGNTTMYLTYYFATNQTWFGEFIKNYILR